MKYLLFLLLTSLTLTAETLSNESELGFILSSGNSSSQTLAIKQLNNYIWSENTLKFNGRLLTAQSQKAGGETARYFGLGLRYERALVGNFSAYLGEQFESDVFANFYRRWSTDAGGKYLLLNLENTTGSIELGYRFIYEDRILAPNVYNSHNFRAYTEWNHKFNKGVSAKFWLEFLDNFADLGNFRINTELSLSVALTEIFAFKTGYLINYNNIPANGALALDTLFTTALVAKF
jgi:putative salt-induced outer membrane protein YdiY